MANFTDLTYRPEWEQSQYSKEEYTNLLKEIATKENKSLMKSGHTLKVASLIERLWFKFIGFLGFEDKTDIIKVNYELLKILRYGVNHYFFEDKEIQKILQSVQNDLSKDSEYNRISQVLGRLLREDSHEENTRLINQSVSAYYFEHKNGLHEAIWPRLFHQYITPLYRNTALVQFNIGRIQVSEKEYEKAVISFQNALEIDPGNKDFIMHLCSTLLLSLEQLNDQQWQEGLQVCDRLLVSLEAIDIGNLSETEYAEIQNLKIKTLQTKAGLLTNNLEEISNLETFNKLIDTHTKIGQEIFDSGNYHEAEIHYKKALTFFTQASAIFPSSVVFPKDLSTSYQKVAFAFEKNQKFIEALAIHNQLKQLAVNDTMFKAQCCQEIARLLSHQGNDEQAWKEMEEAFQLYPKTEYSEQFVELTMKVAQRKMINKHYDESIVYWEKVLEIQPKNREAFLGIVSTYLEMNDYQKAESYLQKALTIDFNDTKAIQLYGLLHEKRGNITEAIKQYTLAFEQEKSPSNKQLLLNALISGGDKIYAKESCRVEQVRQSLIDLVGYAKLAYRTKFEEAFQNKSEEINRFYELGQEVNTPGELERQIDQALETIHNIFNEESMTPELNHYIYTLRQQRSQMIAYYSILKQAVLDFVKEVCDSEYYPDIQSALGNWKGSLSAENKEFKNLGKDIANLDQIEEQFNRAIALVEKAYDGKKPHLSPYEMPEELTTKIDQLYVLLNATLVNHEAIPFYLKAYELSPDDYHEYLNRLIDSYMRMNDPIRAIKWYEALAQKFPDYPLRINPLAYDKVVEGLLNENKFNEAITLINKAIELSPSQLYLRKTLSHIYFFAGELFQNKHNDTSQAVNYYTKAVNCGVDAEAACYARLGQYYETQLRLEDTKSQKNLYNKIKELRKKAAELDPENPEFQFQYGRTLYFEDFNNDEAAFYLEKAVTLAPKNVTYLYGLLMALRSKGNEELFESYGSQFKDLGGNFNTSYWEPVE